MRRSLSTVLPDRIAKRRSKGNPHEAICRAVVRELPYLRLLFKDARVSAYGYVNPIVLFEALDLASHGLKVSFVGLLKTMSLELWLRTLEQPRLSTEPARDRFAMPVRPVAGTDLVQADAAG
jgi:hypothetical protein